jgi:hypothetical protein
MGLIGAACREIWYAVNVIPERPLVWSRPATSRSVQFLTAARRGSRRGVGRGLRVARSDAGAPPRAQRHHCSPNLFRVAEGSQADPCTSWSSDPAGRQPPPWVQTHDRRRCGGAPYQSFSSGEVDRGVFDDSPNNLYAYYSAHEKTYHGFRKISGLFLLNLQPWYYQRVAASRMP